MASFGSDLLARNALGTNMRHRIKFGSRPQG